MEQAQVLAAPGGEGEHFVIGGGDIVTITVPSTATQGRYCVVVERTPPGAGPRPHWHAQFETSTVLEGRARFSYAADDGTRQVDGDLGDVVTITGGVVHRFRNVGESELVQQVIVGPGGLDEFFRASGYPVDAGAKLGEVKLPPREQVLAAAAEHGVHFAGLAGFETPPAPPSSGEVTA